jgi:hypothetical protein
LDFSGVLHAIKCVRFVCVEAEYQIIVHILNSTVINLLDQPAEFPEAEFCLVLNGLAPVARSAARVACAQIHLAVSPDTIAVLGDEQVELAGCVDEGVSLAERQRSGSARRSTRLGVLDHPLETRECSEGRVPRVGSVLCLCDQHKRQDKGLEESGHLDIIVAFRANEGLVVFF